MAMNPSDVLCKLARYGDFGVLLYLPSSYHLFEMLVDSANSPDMFGVDITSGTGEKFAYTCPDDHNAIITRINTVILDDGIRPERFGGLTAFDTGIKIEKYGADGTTVIKDFTKGKTIKKNADWGLLAGVDTPTTFPSAGDDYMPIRWTIKKSGAELHLFAGEQMAFTLQDSTTGITDFCAMAQGIVFPDNF